MTTETITLSSFLLARIAEDEAAAREAASVSLSPWRARLFHGVDEVVDAENDRVAATSTDCETEHIARHDPARVLAECAAKRAIVEMFVADYDEHGLPWGAGGYGEAYCEALQHLAAVYSDHPDYREAWRP